ncbi:4606_t:CDS:2, partial [Gigaspora rosea]
EVSKVCEDSGMEYLKTKKVANIKQKLVGPMNSHLVGDADLKSDISNTIEFLIKYNYQVEKQESLVRLRDGIYSLYTSAMAMDVEIKNSEAVASALGIIRKFAPQ